MNLEKLMKDRKRVFDLFKNFENPFFNICVEFRVQDFFPYCQERGFSSFQFFLYHIAKASLEIDHFRLRMIEGKVIEVKNLYPSYTVLGLDHVFNFATFEFDEDFELFLERSLKAKEIAEKAKDLVEDDLTHRDYLYITSTPGLKVLSMQHPVASAKDCSIPKIGWGKMIKEGRERVLTLCIGANHCLMDGIHIYQYVEKLKQNIEEVLRVKHN
ncbi:MAG: hypothetical protein H6620_07365 [Halobacteriovoraceae bacterium]|nr:hypothetical protein [Halobacteriovoraceae bacterium]